MLTWGNQRVVLAVSTCCVGRFDALFPIQDFFVVEKDLNVKIFFHAFFRPAWNEEMDSRMKYFLEIILRLEK